MPSREDDRLKLIQAYKETFTTEHGSQVLEDLRRLTQINSSVNRLDSTGRIDPYKVVEDLGQRKVMIHIEAMINKDTNIKKQKEAVK